MPGVNPGATEKANLGVQPKSSTAAEPGTWNLPGGLNGTKEFIHSQQLIIIVSIL